MPGNPTNFPTPVEPEDTGPDFAEPLLLDLEEIIPPSDVVASAGEPVTFQAVLGPEHNPEQIRYSWFYDGAPLADAGPELRVNTAGSKAGSHQVKLVIHEEDRGASLTWRLQITEGRVRNRPPFILQAFPPASHDVPRGTAAEFLVVASDVDVGDRLGYSWVVNGKNVPEQSSNLRLDTTGFASGDYTVTVAVLDGAPRPYEETTRYSWVLRVSEEANHSFPYISGAWPIGSPSVHPDGMLRFEVRAEVPDSEDLVSFRWEVDGMLQPSNEPVFQFHPAVTEKGLEGYCHRVTCRMVQGDEETGEVRDAVGWTVHVGRLAALVGIRDEAANRLPPVTPPVSGIIITPGDSRAFKVDAADLDGDVVTFKWFVDGKEQVTEGPVFTYAPPAGTTTESLIEVRGSDGFALGGKTAAWQILGQWSVGPGSLGPFAFALSDDAIIKDNGSSGTTAKGVWLNSSAGGAYGSSSVYSSSSTDTYTYSVSVAPGRYEVLLWWTTWPSRSTAVPISITHANGTSTVNVNQQANGGRWNLLGTYDFSSTAKVVITSKGNGASTCADALCLNPAAASSGGSGDPAPSGTTFVIDDGAAGTSAVGFWSPSSAPSPYGGRSLFARDTGSYTFQRALSASGSYDVYAWWTEWTSRDASVPYEISHSGGTSTVRKDQRSNGGQWNLLGRYAFGSSVKVTVRVVDGDTVCADAIQFVPAGSSPPPPPPPSGTAIIIDNGDTGTTADGFWQPSTAPNPYDGQSLYAAGRGAYVYDFSVPAPGTYGIYVWYTQWSSRESAVPYEVRHDSGTAIVKLDQRVNGGKWNPIGDFGFGATGRVTVRVVDDNTVCADAIRIVPGGGTGITPDPDPEPVDPTDDPAIIDLAAFALTSDIAKVKWSTNFPGDSVVFYGKTSEANESSRTVTGTRWNHSVVLTGLSEGATYYAKVRSSNGSTSKTSSTVSFRIPDSTPSYTITSSHPRMYFTAADISAIRSRVKTSPYSEWWSKVVSFANQELSAGVSSLVNEAPNYNAAVAFAGLIGDSSAWRNLAISVAMKVASLSYPSDHAVMRDRLELMWITYDWLYSYLTSSQRSTLRSKIAQFAGDLEDRVSEEEYADGASNGDQNGAFLAALAIHGEDSSAAGIIQRALVRYNDGFWPFWREHGSQNGGSFKSAWYTTVATQFNYEVFAAWKSATGKDLFQAEQPWFEKLADFYLYSKRGDNSWVRHGDVNYQQGFDEIERYILMHIAREYDNGEAQWLANKIRAHLPIFGPTILGDILWYDASVSPKAPTAMSLSEHFRGCGMVFFQESWQDSAVRANFRAAPYFMAGHSHLDQGSFTIFYKGALALDAGIYDDFGSSHRLAYYGRTISHNAILVDDPDEVFKQYGETRIADAGQYYLEPSRVPHAFPWNITDLTTDDGFHIGGISAYEQGDGYTYALGDATLAYNPLKIKACYRHFLWLDEVSGFPHPVIIVFDEVESTKSTFKKTYLLHTQSKPTVSGTLASTTEDGGLLYQRTVFPTSPQVTLVGGSGKEYWVRGKNYPPSRSPKSGEQAGVWRIEVSPSTARLHDEFLHVLYPTDSGAGAPASVRAIDAAALKGCEIQGNVILFAVKLRSVTTATWTVGGARRNIVFGLRAGDSYDFFLDGSKKATLSVTREGSLDFDTSTSGKVELIRR